MRLGSNTYACTLVILASASVSWWECGARAMDKGSQDEKRRGEDSDDQGSVKGIRTPPNGRACRLRTLIFHPQSQWIVSLVDQHGIPG